MIKKVLQPIALVILTLISLLPFWALYFIADGIFLLLYHAFRYRRKVVDANLKASFPDRTQLWRDDIAKKYYRYLADLIVESIKMLTVSGKSIKRRVYVPNPELITGYFEQGRSVLGILGHYGNWEMNGLRFSQLFKQPRVIVYKPLSNKFFDNVYIKMRSRFGAMLVSMKNITRKLVELRNEPTVTVLVGDQTPARPDVTYFTRFLNQPTAVFLGVEKLAKLTDSVIVFCDIRRVKRGYYQCTFVPMFTNAKATAEHEITKAHVQYLEQVIRHEPQYWLWSHRRWKFSPEEFGLSVDTGHYEGDARQTA